MIHRTLLAALLFATSAVAAVPPAAQLFPDDTLVLLSVADWASAKATMNGAPLGQLWNDAAMRPFRDDFEKKVVAKFIGDMEKDLGIKADEYFPLLQGQVSFAVIRGDWNPANPDSSASQVLVIDAKEKSAELKAKLTEARKKLGEAKKTLKAEKIRDQDFTTVVLDPKPEKGPNKEDEDEKGPVKKIEITFGQVDTALIIGDSVKALEKVVAKLTGGSVPALAEVSSFQSSEAAMGFRKSLIFGWANLAPVFATLESELAKSGGALAAFGVDPKKAVQSLGLRGLKSLSVAARQDSEGTFFNLALAVPEGERTGLFKLIAMDGKDGAPPAFVPADAVDYRRWRINGPKTWANFETLLQQISPQFSGLLQMSIGAMGKDKDPNFDFKKVFVGNLGDDYITYGKAPKGRSPQEIANPPSITLLGAVNADELAVGLKATASLLPGGPDDLKERNFNGKKIVTIVMPVTNPKEKAKVLEIAPSGGYLAISDDASILEEYLRSADGSGKSLKNAPGLAEAAQKVGGMNTGLFGYNDQRESLRGTWDSLRSGNLTKMLPQQGKDATSPDDFADFKLLPSFDQVAKYFGIAVYAGAWDGQGFMVRQFGPNPK